MWCLYKAIHLLSLVLLFLNLQANLSSSSITQLCPPNEASALIQFKNSFSMSEDSSLGCNDVAHTRTDSWKEGTDCCSWDGVTCDSITGQVIGLDLSCSRLYGPFPSNTTLFHLQRLQKLNLAFNNFNHSEMSTKFGEFASLEYLNLSNSNFAGQVPPQISHLSKLVSLDLSREYYLYGGLDQTLDKHTLGRIVHSLTELRQLFLDGINLSSIHPNVLGNLSTSLRSLSLSRCGLQGKLPKNIFHLPNLKLLDLGFNENLSLSPTEFNRSSYLKFLDLSYISIPRELFDSICNLVSLEHLALAKNNLSGQIPSSITNLTKLEFLCISDNNLGGPIPDEVNAFPNLTILDLSNNYLNGTLPSWLYTIPYLKTVYLHNNQFSGHFKEFQLKSSLHEIDLSFNELQGHIPYSISRLLNLTRFDVSSNKLQGPIPSSISQLSNLFFLDLSSNNLQGPIPSSLSQLINLTDLDLSSNNLSGIVEYGMFSKLQNLQYLHLSHNNNLSLNYDDISVDYTLPNLRELSLYSCNVSEFPRFLRDSKNLYRLDLSDNRINGKIPKWMQDVGKNSLIHLNLSHNSLTELDIGLQFPWKETQILDLSSNFIHGGLPIPHPGTYIFFISNNSLSGEISSLICNATSLAFLDLSHNSLSGSIPWCFGNLSKNLRMLSLRKNNFHGTIPPTFTEGCKLQNLNLNDNQLEGPLTRSIFNCTSLEVLDLGNNKIKDVFPHWLGCLPQLQVLVLQSNQLQGSIHDEEQGSNVSFSKIQIFDLSSNNFTGKLPVRYIKNFKAMINLTFNGTAERYLESPPGGVLYSFSIRIAYKGQEQELEKIFTMLTTIDLSNNKFEGEIPEVIGKLNSLIGLKLSHNNLTGIIPTSIGNLKNLEWLDLSSNKLTGTIPERLLYVPWLSFLNLSENQLVGCIPRGKQFNTFENSSYEGNEGLRGFPLSRDCNKSESPQPNVLEEDDDSLNISFGWKVVIGYGCGVVFGLTAGCVVFKTGKPKWIVTLVEDRHYKRRKMSKIGNRRNEGRRI